MDLLVKNEGTAETEKAEAAMAARVSIDCFVDTEPRGYDKSSDNTPVWAEFDPEKL